jgi:hypothetical protein
MAALDFADAGCARLLLPEAVIVSIRQGSALISGCEDCDLRRRPKANVRPLTAPLALCRQVAEIGNCNTTKRRLVQQLSQRNVLRSRGNFG